MCTCLVGKVKVHASLRSQNVDVEFAVRGKVFHRPRTDHRMLVLCVWVCVGVSVPNREETEVCD